METDFWNKNRNKIFGEQKYLINQNCLKNIYLKQFDFIESSIFAHHFPSNLMKSLQ